jgi:hypothetical protein
LLPAFYKHRQENISRREAMTMNKMFGLVNKDDTLLALLSGILLVGIALIGLIVYVGMKLLS